MSPHSRETGRMAPRPGAEAIHATAVVVGETGIIIRGRSGSGKSSVALALLDLAASRGGFARLVGDDRICVSRVNGRLVAAPHSAIAGKIEWRGAGILDVEHEQKAIVRLVIDLLDANSPCGIPPRLPMPADRCAEIAATTVPRLALRAGAPAGQLAEQILLLLTRIGIDG